MRMMKAVLLVTALVASASAAHAASMTFGLGGGISSPSGDFGKISKLGTNGGVYGDYWIKDDYAFGVDITGSFLSAKDGSLAKTPSYPNPEFKTTLTSFGLHGKWAIPMKDTPVQPSLTYGAGLYSFSSKLTGAAINSSINTSKFGFNGGAGVDFKAGAQMRLGADVKYHYIMDAIAGSSSTSSKKAANYITAGVNLTFMTSGGN